MAYNGSVELISGIKQKNNGIFPLVDASAVRVTDDSRLDAELEGLKDELEVLEPAATNSDVGKYPRVKTVSGGKVTEYEFAAGGSVGTSDYSDLLNKPSINSVTLTGNKTLANLGIAPESKGTFVTPEDFGAVGDGDTDDTTAVQAAINYGVSNQVSVRGYKVYKTTSPLVIDANYLDVLLHKISYTGSDYGISITGSYNNVRLEQLYCTNGRGVVMTRTEQKVCFENKVTIMRLYAKGHGVDFVTNGYYILYNTFDIRLIKSDTGNCFNGAPTAGENVFMNSSCACENGWAIYIGNGKFYNFTFEANVLNGIYNPNGGYFTGFRIREMVDKLVRRIAGTEPGATGGTLIKYVGVTNHSKFDCEDYIPYEAIDVSEMLTLDDILAEDPVSSDKIVQLSFASIIDAPIRYGQWETKNGFFMAGKRMIVTGGRKICVPMYETEYTITAADFDMRDTQVALNNAKPYPTKMIIGVDNCVIHLPASYCAYGYSDFIVDQTNHACTIYDVNSSVTPIFNGATRGPGVYKFHAYCDTKNNIFTVIRPAYDERNFNDTENFVWEITKLGDNSSSSTNVGIINVADYGAVGDGVTDDSQAIQDAVDAGYDIYFESNKTYYIESAITITDDRHLHGGENTVIKRSKATGNGQDGIVASGTLKKTTSLTSDYVTSGTSGDNAGNKFTLTDMTDIAIGDVMVVQATDQYYSYERQYYYLGATLLVSDVYDGHIYTSNSMPFGITNTQNVTVKIYSAPQVIIENLHFMSDISNMERWYYSYLVRLENCKNSIVRNCDFSQFCMGVTVAKCVNTLIDNVTLSKSKYDNTITGDGYGIEINSSSDTKVNRLFTMCAQNGLDVTGQFPNINTYVCNSNINAECRGNGLGMHENSYNIVVEDCVLGGVSLFGTATLNRCRIIQNNRVGGDTTTSITVYGSHNPEWARYKIANCTMSGTYNGITIAAGVPQTPVQSIDSIVGLLEVTNCTGGTLKYTPTLSTGISSSSVQQIVIDNWHDCYEIYHTNAGTIGALIVRNSTFIASNWLNRHADGFYTDAIGFLRVTNSYPQADEIAVNADHGDIYYLPEGTKINFSSSDTSAHYIVCGTNIASNDTDDYSIGSVSGSSGNALTRTVDSNFSTALSVNSSGELVYTQPNNTTKHDIYLKCMMYAKDASHVMMSCKLKNTGETSAASFRPYIAVVSASTGLVTYKGNGTAAQATTAGAVITHSRDVPADSYVLMYLYCNEAVANSETTFSEYVAEVLPFDPYWYSTTVAYEPYIGYSRDGDGALTSIPGKNIILTESSSAVSITFKADLLKQTQLTSATGVSF